MTTTGWFAQLTSLSLITRVWFYAFDATIPGYLVSRFEGWHTCYLTQKSSSPARRFVCSRRPWLQTTVTWRARDCSRAEDYRDVLFFHFIHKWHPWHLHPNRSLFCPPLSKLPPQFSVFDNSELKLMLAVVMMGSPIHFRKSVLLNSSVKRTSSKIDS